ncbi:MAG: HTH-type transcriptional regulator BetI [Candidatus Celerinatantimonas neptuna]|nr:MAG: HTH-type transcriptional regulator BetI [Candidatus Celerinatantimonas neptuna]
MPEIRRPQLINATMEVIDEVGLSATSIALISRKAGVSTGIINHYFSGKHGLLEATIRSILDQLATGIRDRLNAVPQQAAIERIQAIIEGNFTSHQLQSKVVHTWLAFWAQSVHDPKLHRLQRVNAQRLISHLQLELKKILPKPRARFVAHGIAALIDGIWIRGALTPNGIDQQQAITLVNDYLAKELPN